MDKDFWLDRWQRREIGFHNAEANPMLVTHFEALRLAERSRVFVPLCGKTLDIGWLLGRGMRVVGAELSPVAVGELFAELGVEPEIAPAGAVEHHRAPDLEVFVGDLFTLDAATLGPVDAVYDRAALVALPGEMRRAYAEHLHRLTPGAGRLLIVYEYDQRQVDGPPFAVHEAEVRELFESDFRLTLLEREPIAEGLKGKAVATRVVWRLESR